MHAHTHIESSLHHPYFYTCQKKQCIYLARTNCWLGLFVPGPVGLHRMVYISYKIMHPSQLTIWEYFQQTHKQKRGTDTLTCSFKSCKYLSCFVLHICVKRYLSFQPIQENHNKEKPIKQTVLYYRDTNMSM